MAAKAISRVVYLAGAARAAGYQVAIYDAMPKNTGYEEIEYKIRSYRPDFVAASVFTCTEPDAIEVIEVAKKVSPDIRTILGGVHSSFMYDEMFSKTAALDFIVRGEGERTIVELLDTITAGGDLAKVQGIVYRGGDSLAVPPARPLLENLDNQPMAWDLLDWNDYHYFIIPGSRLGAVDTSRGCDKECTFCSQQKYWKRKWRARSPKDIVREMLELRDRFGVNVVLFTDDYPTPDRARWERLLDLLIEKKQVDHGLAVTLNHLLETNLHFSYLILNHLRLKTKAVPALSPSP